MRKFIFLSVLIVCVVTVFPFWIFVIEHMLRGHNTKTILQIIIDEIVLYKKI